MAKVVNADENAEPRKPNGKKRARVVMVDSRFIKEYRDQLRELAGKLTSSMEAMEEKGLEEIQINGVGIAELGLDYLARFVTHVQAGAELAKAAQFRSAGDARRRRSGVE